MSDIVNIKSININNNLNVIENSFLNNLLCKGKLSVKGITKLENAKISNLLIANDISVNSTLFINNINILGKINNDEFKIINNNINNLIPNEFNKLKKSFNHIINKHFGDVSYIFKKHDKKFNDFFDLITIQHITNNLITQKIKVNTQKIKVNTQQIKVIVQQINIIIQKIKVIQQQINIIIQKIKVIQQQINIINKKLDQFEPVVINDDFILPLNINMIVLINKSTRDIKITSNNGNIFNPFYCDPNGSDVTFIPRKSTFTFRHIDNEWYF
jgi:hypothetical protein